MRTKTLLIAAASALAAAVTSTQAQTVYSQNIVGYVNLSLPQNAYTLVAPALDVDGTGTNGTISTVVGTNVDLGTVVLAWNGTGYDTLTYQAVGHGNPPNWQLSGVGADPSYKLNVGEGFFINSPAATYTNITETGVVMQGGLTNGYVSTAGNYSLLASTVPIGGDLTTNLNYIPSAGDVVLIWNGTGYNTYTYQAVGHGNPPAWQLSGVGQQDPVLSVGQGFFLNPAANNTWVQTFTNN